MAISGFGNTQNSLKLTTAGQASNLKKVELKPVKEEQPEAKPSAVWIYTYELAKDFSLTRPGDVIITDSGFAYRHCIDKDGNHSWQETIYVRATDFEADRGDFRKV